MKRMLAFLFLMGTALAQNTPTSYGIGAFNPGAPPQTCPVTFTANGGGTGGVVDSLTPPQINFTYNGTTTSGSTSGNYTCGSNVTFTPSTTGGSTYAWGPNSFSPPCGGSGACSVIVSSTSGYSAVAHWTAGGGGGTIPSYFDGIGINGGFPTIPFDFVRQWDTCGGEWPFIESCNKVGGCTPNDVNLAYTFANNCNKTSGFDTWAADAFASGIKSMMFTIGSRTPWFASANPTDTSCNYNCSSGTLQSNGQCSGNQAGKSGGQCDAPSDVNTNGTGANLYFRYWVKNFGAHVTNGTWLLSHAPVNYLEILNEPDTNAFAKHTYDQQGRIAVDTAQLYVGDSTWHFTISAVSGSCVYTISNFNGNPNGASGTLMPSGYYAGYHVNTTGLGIGGNNLTNATITASTSTTMTLSSCAHSAETHAGDLLIVNTYTGETAAQTQATVGLSGAINTNATIMTSSYHPQGASSSMPKLACALYCSGSCTAAGNSCSAPTAFFETAVNMHQKPGNDAPSTAENDIDTSTTNLTNTLTAQEQAKPLFGPEAAYTGSTPSWVDGSCANPPNLSCGPPYFNYGSDFGMQASFLVRIFIYFQNKNWISTTWYNWKGTLGNALLNAAFTAMHNEMLGITQPTCAQGTPGTATHSGASAVFTYTCPYTDTNTHAAAFLWDNSQYCTGNNSTTATVATCTATQQTVGSSYLSWTPLVSMTISGTTYNAGTGYTITSHQMPVPIIPVKLCTVAAGSCS